jgi:hypothetical protein
VCVQQRQSLIQCNRQLSIRLTSFRQSVKVFVADQQSLKPTLSEEVIKCVTRRGPHGDGRHAGVNRVSVRASATYPKEDLTKLTFDKIEAEMECQRVEKKPAVY